MFKVSRLTKAGSFALLGALLLNAPPGASAQASGPQEAGMVAALLQEDRALERYLDPAAGLTVEQAVSLALERNGELLALRKELDAAHALVRQANLRANPMLDAGGSKQLNGGDNSVMVAGTLPLELGGRRAARVLVAEREAEMRALSLADRERVLASEVRGKFGEVLAEILKLGFTDERLNTSRRGYRLVAARVEEGRTAPLERNMVLVEVNRLLSMREAGEGRVQVALLELKNALGFRPEEPLRLRGDFIELIGVLPSVAASTERALRERPDLKALRAAELLAEAQIAEARAGGRADAALTAGYQRMRQGFMVNGIDDAGRPAPVDMTSHSVTFGVRIDLPLRNKNQGAIEAAVLQREAARDRREFFELTVRREVASAHARYERAARAMEIFRVGVREQADANLEVIRKTYELGSKTLLDYIAEQRRFYEVEAEFIDAVLNTYLARVEVGRSAAAQEFSER